MSSTLIEHGRHFSEDCYATKEEVKAVYNTENIDSIWKNILSYRSFYDEETELRDSNSLPYKICLTKSLLSKSYFLQTKLSNDMLKYVLLPNELKNEFLITKKTETLEHTSKLLNISCSVETLRKLACNELENIPSSLYALKAYCDSYSFAMNVSEINIETIEKLNCFLCGEDENDYHPQYRNKDEGDVINTLNIIKNEEIKTHLNNLCMFLKQKNIPTILKALSIPFYILSVRPFEYYNEETASLLCKIFLNIEGFSTIGFSLNFESICYSTSKSFFNSLKHVESSLDLTYALIRFLDFENQCEERIQDELKELSIKKVTLSDETLNGNIKPYTDISIIEQNSYALPSFQAEENEEEIKAKARKLLELHPDLKKKQAHFYAGHCVIGLHYTIEQFKKEERTVYETARTSMDFLASKGFYKKELIGKKFVYSPIERKD